MSIPEQQIDCNCDICQVAPLPTTCNTIPVKALRALGGWGSYNFQTFGTRKWQDCQSYAPAAFTPH
jgi:hypothetical protein